MQIRAFRASDEAAVIALWERCRLTRPWNEGLGRALMQEVEKRLLERGCPKLNVQVRASNAEAMAFYRRLGYAQDEAVALGKRLIPDR